MPVKEEPGEALQKMKKLGENIKDFLEKNRVASVCYTDERNIPNCFACFFVLSGVHPSLVFKSSYGTAHEEFTRFSHKVAGTVLPEKLDILNIKGVQFAGHTLNEASISPELISDYYSKYPFARIKSGYIWVVQLDMVKFTDNTIVFGQKTLWNAQTTSE